MSPETGVGKDDQGKQDNGFCRLNRAEWLVQFYLCGQTPDWLKYSMALRDCQEKNSYLSYFLSNVSVSA